MRHHVRPDFTAPRDGDPFRLSVLAPGTERARRKNQSTGVGAALQTEFTLTGALPEDVVVFGDGRKQRVVGHAAYFLAFAG